MKIAEVKFEIEYSDNIEIDELQEFIEFELGVIGNLSMSNPLSDTDIMSMGINQVSID